MTLHAIYIKISQVSVLMPIIAGIIYYKALTKPFKVLFYFFVIASLFEIQASITAAIYHNNMPGQHIYTVVEFLALSTVYFLHMQKNSIAQYLISINTIVFIGIACKNAFYDSGGFMVSNDLSRSYSSVFMIVYTLSYLYYLFQKDATLYMWQYPMFWFCTGTLIYFGGNILHIQIRKELIHDIAMERLCQNFHALLNIIAYCLYTQSFRCFGKQKKLLY
jgi:hypothetical protein